METNTNKYIVPLAIVIAGAMISGAIYFGGSGGSVASNSEANAVESTNIAPVSAEDHIRGNPDAALVIVEYSDLECPFCKVFHNTMRQIMSEYDGKVAWVYRHFPIPQLHHKAPHEAEASECAAELGGNIAFWQFVDEVFKRTNSNDSLDPAELPKIAGDIGLDTVKFNSCLSSGKYTEAIQKSAEAAVEAGARGTPYSVIISGDQKVVINGAEPIESVRAKIDSLLK